MITHYIYEIPGRKVGCCKSIIYRMSLYKEIEGSVPSISILEELHDSSDQEAGDREWYWADVRGYPRGVHYIVTMNAVRIRGRKGQERSMLTTTFEERSLRSKKIASIAGSIGGKRSAELGFGFKQLSSYQQSELGSRGGQTSAKLGLGFSKIDSVCPHCGKVSNVANLKRWHFDNCKHKNPRFIRRA